MAKQSADHSLMTYAPLDVIMKALEFHSDEIKGFAYILHKYDKFPEGHERAGEFKEPHYHIVLRLWKKRTLSAVRRWFWCVDENGPVNTFSEDVFSVQGAYAYLTHKYDPDKYQYDPASIVVSDRKWFEVDYYADADSATLAFEMAVVGVNPYVIAKRFGRDFIYHQHDIYELRDRTLEYAQSSPSHRDELQKIIYEICESNHLEI